MKDLQKPDIDLLLCSDGQKTDEIVGEITQRLNVNIINERPGKSGKKLYLQLDEDGISLVEDKLVVRGDFTRMLSRLKTNNLQGELLVKAARMKGLDRTPVAVDATAGLGEDAILLAAAGFEVQLYEYNPVIGLLLWDALRRGKEIPELADTVGRMNLKAENSLMALPALTLSPDVVVLDPMFPEKQKKNLVKKKFQLIQQLELPCSDGLELLQAAMAAHPKKIVIKRPVKGPCLGEQKPSYSICGKNIRYDCFVPG